MTAAPPPPRAAAGPGPFPPDSGQAGTRPGFAGPAIHALARFLAERPALLEPLRAVAALALPDAWIGAGFVRNAAWDAIHGLPSGANPPADVDVVWFDPARAAPADDEAAEARLRAVLPAVPWQVRNQARMAAGNDDAPYASTLHAVSRWPDTATAVAARWNPATGAVEIAAPWGVEDLLAGVVRPTPAFAADPAKREAFARRIEAKGWLRRWPALRVLPDPPPPAASQERTRP